MERLRFLQVRLEAASVKATTSYVVRGNISEKEK